MYMYMGVGGSEPGVLKIQWGPCVILPGGPMDPQICEVFLNSDTPKFEWPSGPQKISVKSTVHVFVFF